MLTLEQINQNKEKFIELVKSITVEGADIDGLVSFLENSDFFFAPATSISHGNYDGGLCEHSLNVYKQLRRLVKGFASHVETQVSEDGKSCGEEIILHYSEDTIKIVGLLHDLSKVNYYEKYNKNVKNEATGKWEQEEHFKIKEPEDRNICGDGAFNSFLEISRFLPLTQEEIATIVNFNCGMDNGYSNKDIYAIMEKYPLTVLLHNADMISSFVDKK